MRVIKEAIVFKPVHIVLEKQKEVDLLRMFLDSISQTDVNNILPGEGSFEDTHDLLVNIGEFLERAVT